MSSPVEVKAVLWVIFILVMVSIILTILLPEKPSSSIDANEDD